MRFFKEKIMPSIVLCLMCAVICGLLVGAYELTYVDNTGVMTDELKAGCEDIFGDGSYSILKDENGEVVEFDGVTAVITDEKGELCLFEIYESGYNKDGVHVLIGIGKEGSVEGIYFLSCGETPGLGTKATDKGYLKKYNGISDENDVSDVDNVTGASYTSKGLKSAVTLAVKTYNENREAILSE